jgi:hypothetical protein
MTVATAHIYPNGDVELAISQRTGKDIIRGKDRKGIRAGDFEKETSPKRHPLDNPQAEKARLLVETGRVVGTKIEQTGVLGADELTAQDTAAHEYLLACARHAGIDKPLHHVSMKRLCEYLGVASAERVWQSLERLQRTMVRYSIVDPQTRRRVLKSMIEFSSSTNRLTGKTIIQYAIPGVVRDAILQSRSYTWLDINVFAKFKSKYSGRLYPKLALMAGYDARVRKPWTPTIEELATFIGYAQPGEAIHIGSFMRQLDKALAEIAQYVLGFSVTCAKPKRGEGRGRPVEGAFHITTTDVAKSLYAYRPAVLGPAQVGRIEDRRNTPLKEREHPETAWFARAQMMTGIDADKLFDRWRLDVVAARLNPDRRTGAMTGALLIALLDGEGLRVAFKRWVELAVVMEEAGVGIPEVSDDTPRFVPGKLTGTWVEEELWYADGYDEDDEAEDLRMAGDYDLDYGVVDPH